MAETTEFAITNSVWTDVTTSTGVNGFITNGSDNDVLFTQQETAPAITLTAFHRLRPSARVNYSVTGSEVVYMRSTIAVGKVLVTPGVLT